MVAPLQLYLFGDQTFDVQPHLKNLLRYRNNPVLEDFLTKAYSEIRQRLYTLPSKAREDLPRFTCIDDLLLWKPTGKRCVPLDMAVTCLYQTSTFITQASDGYPRPDSVRLLGLCTGTLAAAAISCSRSVIELVPLAVQAVAVAFETGKHVAELAERIEPSSNSSTDHTWSILVGGLAAVDAVTEFSKQSKLPLTRRPYVSAYAPSGITVSAPPGSLHSLVSSPAFKDFKYRNIPIHGPFHTSNLSSTDDVDAIVANLDAATAAQPNVIPLILGNGDVAQAHTFESLLKMSISQILLHPIQWIGVLAEVRKWLEVSSAVDTRFLINAVGSTAESLIYNDLKQINLKHALMSPSSKTPIATDPAFPGKGRLAIVASSGRFPGAEHNDAFWDLLYRGLDVHKEVPALHWDVKTHVDPSGKAKNTSATPFGCWLDEPAQFDARFFNISPREADQMDPAQRIALMTAYEAIEQAGIVPDATPSTRRDRVGVFYGVTSNDWMETNSAQDINTYFIPGGNRAFIPGRINYYFKFSGPSYAVDTACSSSLSSVHIACNALWRGDIDTAIAGGTNVLTNPDFTAGLDRGHFLSRTGNCKTFDDSADGYCRGEGIGTVIIKRLEDAIADKDPIQAIILGAYTNHSAESESITRPHVGAQRDIFKKILNQAAVDPYDISYIEMHGTGTQAGDAAEMSSVVDTFAPSLDLVRKGRTDDQSLYLGSTKANIGHGEAAAGVSSIIKILLMMKNDMIPPHCGIKTKINHRFPADLDQRKVRIASKPTEWKRNSNKPRRVFVNNFSAAGGNSALLLEDAPPVMEELSDIPDLRGSHLVAISAKNSKSLKGNLENMLRFLKGTPDVSSGQLSYTTTARRLHHPHRVMLQTSGNADLVKQIEASIADGSGMARPKSTPKIIFTFTGNGAQYPGMSRDLHDSHESFRSEMHQLDKLGQNLGFPSFLPVIQSADSDIGAFAPTVVQLATTALQIALAKLWKSWGVQPIAVVGHSLGEYAALNVAGVLSDSDALYLVGSRAQLLEEKCSAGSHAMIVVKGTVESAQQAIEGLRHEVACINSPVETVLAGTVEEVEGIRVALDKVGLKSTLLKVPYAFHSSQVDPILDDFTALAGSVTLSTPKLPILCPLDGSIIDENTRAFSPSYFSRHCREPVNMLEALTTASVDGIVTDATTTIEIGPHPAVSGMVKANMPKTTNLPSLQRGRDTWQTLTAVLKTLYVGGADIAWGEYHKDFPASHKVLSLPAYKWDLKHYWMQYVNDWSLRKGDPPLVISSGTKLESTTIHRILEETGNDGTGKLVVEADINRKDLSPLVQGHEVDGIPLCTPSVYCDMALSMGKYLLEKYRSAQKEKNVDVTDMNISKALILNDQDHEQLLQAHGEYDFSKNSASIIFKSFDAKQKLHEHARCVVRFVDKSLKAKLAKEAVDIRGKIMGLRAGVARETTARFNRPMVYRAIRPLARFHDDYRVIDEILLDSNTLEAASELSFTDIKREGNYHLHPAIIDAFSQICGFIMNCNDGTDLDNEVYMNHGWGGFQIFEPISFDKKYITYSQMTEGPDKLWYGDVLIFDGEKVVASFRKVAIQGVPRRVLKVILSIESGRKGQKGPVQQTQSKSKLLEQKNITATAPTPVQKSTVNNVTPDSSPKVAQAMAIIAEESGVAEDELTDDSNFADIGIDSLMGLTISARFKDELDLDIDFSSLFFEAPAVKDLKKWLRKDDVSADSVVESFEHASDVSSDIGSHTDMSSAPATRATSPDSKKEASDGHKPNELFQKALEIIADESGVAVEDLTDETSFADSGIDSLMSLVVVSRFRDELDIDVQHDMLFLECPTVADLRKNLFGGAGEDPLAKAEPLSTPVQVAAIAQTPEQTADLARRKQAVDAYISKYAAGFSVSPATGSITSQDKVVLVTGGTGSLGSHIVYHLAQLPSIKTVVCLNRENRVDGLTRQLKSMREKGIRFPENLLPKLKVIQSDSTKPLLGLPQSDYDLLANSVTHLIHNAWTMSAKRPLSGFESQFQIFRNLLDLSSSISSRRAPGFKFSFQMVSSIGVVGHHDLNSNPDKSSETLVPEFRVGIESVLPNGYSEAKWGCERMLDETLHAHPERFRPTVVRLGQIAGSKTSGYWNPMEHFGFLVKSSQTLKALPDLGGRLFWTPVNDIAGALSDLVLGEEALGPVYHIENPVGQSWREMNGVIARALNIGEGGIIPFEEWLERVKAQGMKDNPAATLLEFLDDNFLRMSCGGLVLDTKRACEDSETLRGVGPVSEIVCRKYIYIWREIGFLKCTDEEREGLKEERERLWPKGR